MAVLAFLLAASLWGGAGAWVAPLNPSLGLTVGGPASLLRNHAALSHGRSAFAATPVTPLTRGGRSSRRHAGGVLGATSILNEPTPPNDKVLNAVDKLGRRTTVSDLAAATGLGITEAQDQLSTLASLTAGNLEVSSEGVIVYSFDKGYRKTLSARSGKRRLQEQFDKVKPVLFYLTKVSFGIALISSIALIFTAIIVLQSSTRDDRDDRRDRGFGGGGMNMFFGPSYWWGPSPFDFLFWNPYQPYGVNRYRDPSELSFLESVFSFLFGDGDPNSDLEDRRYRAIAQVIRDNGGAVTAEQIAPYMDPDRAYGGGGGGAMPDEAFILPAIQALKGTPEVTEDGDIVYVFDELQESAGGGAAALGGMSARELKAMADAEGISTAGMYDRDDLATGLSAALALRQQRGGASPRRPYLEEQEYQFSLATTGQQFGVAALGALNLVGALYLGNLLASPYIAGKTLVGLLGFVQAVYPALVAYAAAFVAVPVARYFKVKADNAKIEGRNRDRASWGYALDKAGSEVSRKLKGAKKLATKVKVIGKDDIDYSTGESAVDQELKDWDKKFGKDA